MLSFTAKEERVLRRLNSPAKIQDFLNTIPINFEHDGKDTCKSPIRVLREWNAHCIEGAIFGAYVLSLQGRPPLLMHLRTTKKDWNHVVALFTQDGYWGALSKTNHAVLRYREPVYKAIRELALSYFHEYFTDDGKKTLSSYSKLLNLNSFEDSWPVEETDLWGIDEELERIKHYAIAPARLMRQLRLADPLEREAGKLTDWTSEK